MSMTVKELKVFAASIPDEFDDREIRMFDAEHDEYHEIRYVLEEADHDLIITPNKKLIGRQAIRVVAKFLG